MLFWGGMSISYFRNIEEDFINNKPLGNIFTSVKAN